MGNIFGTMAYPLTFFLFLKKRSQTKGYGFRKSIKKAFEGIKLT